jgi:hypothetical protein
MKAIDFVFKLIFSYCLSFSYRLYLVRSNLHPLNADHGLEKIEKADGYCLIFRPLDNDKIEIMQNVHIWE